MTEHEERVFEAKAEREFRGHRAAPDGRNFLAFVERFHGGNVQRNFDVGMCRTFKNAKWARQCGACSYEDCDLRGGENV